jgi:hypothetical protein
MIDDILYCLPKFFQVPEGLSMLANILMYYSSIIFYSARVGAS